MAGRPNEAPDWLVPEQMLLSPGRLDDPCFAGLSSQLLHPPTGYLLELQPNSGTHVRADAVKVPVRAQLPVSRLPLQQLRDLTLYQHPVVQPTRGLTYGENAVPSRSADVEMAPLPVKQLCPPSPPARALVDDSCMAHRGLRRIKRAASSPPEHAPARHRTRLMTGAGGTGWAPAAPHNTPAWAGAHARAGKQSSPCFDTWTPDEELRRPANRMARMLSGSGTSLLGRLSPFTMLKDPEGDNSVKLSDINALIQRKATEPVSHYSPGGGHGAYAFPHGYSHPLVNTHGPPPATVTARPMSAPSPGVSQRVSQQHGWQSTTYMPAEPAVRTIAKHDVPGTNITFRRVSAINGVPPFRL